VGRDVEGKREREARGLRSRRPGKRGWQWRGPGLRRDGGGGSGGFVGAVVVGREEVGDRGVEAAGEGVADGGGEAPLRVGSHVGGGGGRRDREMEGEECPRGEGVKLGREYQIFFLRRREYQICGP
jgi:hypothetical protein